MITSIRYNNFEAEVVEEKRPVLLVHLNRYFEFEEQVEVLESISEKYSETLKVCLISEDFIRMFSWMHGIKGAPTFIIFHEGKEIKLMLGKADRKTLTAFMSQTLPYFQDDCLKRNTC